MRMPGLVPTVDPDVRERRIGGLLFFLTCGSVFTVNLFRWQEGISYEAMERSLWFTATLMSILLAHELGHYAVARWHGFRLSMPWFIPWPFLIGTLGAIIRLREHPRSRSGLLEMGAAGPLAGMVVIMAVVALWTLGAPVPLGVGDWQLTSPGIFWLMSYLLLGSGPAAISVHDPLAFAAWIGCLVTAMNLLPFGQLDGGHVASALVPALASRISWFVTALLVAGSLWWPAWGMWAVALHVLGVRQVLRVRQQAPPTRRAVLVAVLGFLTWSLCFTPVPVHI